MNTARGGPRAPRQGLEEYGSRPDGSRIVWVVNDPVDGDGWSSAQLNSIQRLLPHIRQCVRVQQALAGASALGASLATLLDTTGGGGGIVQLDGRGRIVAANDRARDVIRTGEGLFDDDGFLHARSTEDDAQLQAVLAQALPPFRVQGAAGSTMVSRPSPRPPLALHVNPVGRPETDLRVWPVAALVLVADPASRTRIDPAVAAEALGLTGMESRVAVRDFVQDECVSRGMVADVAIHGADTRNPHAHVLLTTRRIGPDGFEAKDRSWNDRKLLQVWRVEWGSWANRYLDVAGRPERIDHRTLSAQRHDALARGDIEAAKRLDRAPDIHHGKAAWMEARGQASERGERSREIDDDNAALWFDTTHELARINGRLRRERRRLARQARLPQRPRGRSGPDRGDSGWSR